MNPLMFDLLIPQYLFIIMMSILIVAVNSYRLYLLVKAKKKDKINRQIR
jgi:hypothetical protein